MSYTDESWGPIPFFPRNMTVTAVYPHWAPEPDATKHLGEGGLPTCFLAYGNPSRMAEGYWWSSQLPLTSLMNDPNAINIRLTGFNFSKEAYWWGPTATEWADFIAKLDGVDLDLPTGKSLPNGVSQTRTFSRTLVGSNIQFGLYQGASATITGWVESHLYGYEVFGLYDTSTTPIARQLTFHVFDPFNGVELSNVLVQVYSGEYIKAQGKTTNGLITLNVFNKVYTFKAFAAGYTPYPATGQIDLTQGDVIRDIQLTYVGGEGFILPDWWWIPVVGVGALGVVWMLVRRRRKGRDSSITVIK